MRPKRPIRRTAPENTIPLINVVFLMLIFFLLAGSVARDDARRITPPLDIAEDERIRSTGALVVDRQGMTRAQERAVSVEDWVAARKESERAADPVKIAVDADLEADKLEKVLKALSDAGEKQVVLITRKRTP